MMNRRTFLGTSAATLLASEVSWALPRVSGFVLTNPESKEAHKIKAVGVQLYTVRDAMKSDFEGTLAKVAQIGYKEVEFAGYFDHSPKGISALLISSRKPAKSAKNQAFSLPITITLLNFSLRKLSAANFPMTSCSPPTQITSRWNWTFVGSLSPARIPSNISTSIPGASRWST